MKTIEYISPNEMKATRKVIEKLTVKQKRSFCEEECEYYASGVELRNNYFWVFELIDGFQFNPKLKGQNQTWKIDYKTETESMLFRCFVSGKVVASRLVEWVTFPIKSLELYVIDGVIRLTKKRLIEVPEN